MNIQCNSDSPYGEVIRRYFEKEFPEVSTPGKGSLLEILSEIINATKELRYGPMPSPESLVVIRDVIRKSIELSAPIPVLTAWGGIKGNMTAQVDVAEVSALQQLINLDHKIRKIYSPGLQLNIRVEDTGAYWLYRDMNRVEQIANYTQNFSALVAILKGSSNINAVPESMFMNYPDYEKRSMELRHPLMEYLVVTDAYPESAGKTQEWKRLQETGWLGEIPKEQRDYYRSRYKALYPHLSDVEATWMLADYFAGAKARYDLKGRAVPQSEVGSHIQMSFVPPIPGAPTSLVGNTVFYRTVPYSQGRSHIAAWRAKGYLAIDNEGIHPKVTTWNDHEKLAEMTGHTTTLSDGSRSITIGTDYICTD